jgi:hypothetical protein
MKSLAKPRKITIRGSDGQTYMFLGKPRDDLRKDARLMDFNSIINKLLKANSESRRRQLRKLTNKFHWKLLTILYADIRTYGVVTLNEECGFIQWVPNTIPIRPVILKGYDSRGVKSWVFVTIPSYSYIIIVLCNLRSHQSCKIFIKGQRTAQIEMRGKSSLRQSFQCLSILIIFTHAMTSAAGSLRCSMSGSLRHSQSRQLGWRVA